MSKFFPGQPVRIVYCLMHPELSGLQTRVVSGPHRFMSINSGGQYDGYRVEIDPHFAPRAEQLEPIVPEGERASDYSLCELLDRCKQGEGVTA